MAYAALMAQKYIVELIDDLDGSTASETVAFGLDGKSFVIDLSDANARALRDALEPYAAAARRDGAKLRAVAGGKAKRTDLAAIRSWAQSNGYTVADRGRIPAGVVEAYDAAS